MPTYTKEAPPTFLQLLAELLDLHLEFPQHGILGILINVGLVLNALGSISVPGEEGVWSLVWPPSDTTQLVAHAVRERQGLDRPECVQGLLTVVVCWSNVSNLQWRAMASTMLYSSIIVQFGRTMTVLELPPSESCNSRVSRELR